MSVIVFQMLHILFISRQIMTWLVLGPHFIIMKPVCFIFFTYCCISFHVICRVRYGNISINKTLNFSCGINLGKKSS